MLYLYKFYAAMKTTKTPENQTSNEISLVYKIYYLFNPENMEHF